MYKLITPSITGEAWNEIITKLPHPHLLQTWQWAQFKSNYGWQPIPCLWQDEQGNYVAAAMILQRSISKMMGGACVLYVPKGPLLDWGNDTLRSQVFDDLRAIAKQCKAIFIKIDADILVGQGSGEEDDPVVEDDTGKTVLEEMKTRGWRFSDEQIQFRNTVMLDVTADEEQMLGRMKQKTRYNVRLAGKKGVVVRKATVDDLPMLYQMYLETSTRDGFVIRGEEYYVNLWKMFMDAKMATPLIAEVDGEAIASIAIFHFFERAWYIHGMSRNIHRERMPNYLLQWEGMLLAKALGCKTYDLWGAPDQFNEQDSMWGVYLFKRGLGGYVVRTMGAYDLPMRPMLYQLYTQILPRLLEIMRRRAKADQQSLT